MHRNIIKTVSIMATIFMLSACMPMGDETINSELFKNTQELKEQVSKLKLGMTKWEAFNTIGIDESKFDNMSTAIIQMSLYGSSIVQGTPEDLERFRKKIKTYEGFSLHYRNLEKKGTLGFAKMKVDQKGHDLLLHLIFNHGKLVKSSVEGRHSVNKSEDQYIWSPLIQTGLSVL